jgi:hypothetical protein
LSHESWKEKKKCLTFSIITRSPKSRPPTCAHTFTSIASQTREQRNKQGHGGPETTKDSTARRYTELNSKIGFMPSLLATDFEPACIAQLLKVELLQRRLRLNQIQGNSLAKFRFSNSFQYKKENQTQPWTIGKRLPTENAFLDTRKPGGLW